MSYPEWTLKPRGKLGLNDGKWTGVETDGESQRDSGAKPKVARNELFAKRNIVPVVLFSPGNSGTRNTTLKGLRPIAMEVCP